MRSTMSVPRPRCTDGVLGIHRTGWLFVLGANDTPLERRAFVRSVFTLEESWLSVPMHRPRREPRGRPLVCFAGLG